MVPVEQLVTHVSPQRRVSPPTIEFAFDPRAPGLLTDPLVFRSKHPSVFSHLCWEGLSDCLLAVLVGACFMYLRS